MAHEGMNQSRVLAAPVRMQALPCKSRVKASEARPCSYSSSASACDSALPSSQPCSWKLLLPLDSRCARGLVLAAVEACPEGAGRVPSPAGLAKAGLEDRLSRLLSLAASVGLLWWCTSFSSTSAWLIRPCCADTRKCNQ